MSDPPSGDEIDFDEGTQDSDIGSLGGGDDPQHGLEDPRKLTNDHRYGPRPRRRFWL